MIPVAVALDRVLALASPPRAERIALAEADGRVLLEPATARLTQPPFDAAAMDGYALREADLDGPIRVIGTAAAGHPWSGSAAPGTAVRIFTGAAVPAGYDRVIMQEHAHLDGELLRVTSVAAGRHIRARGNDFAEGDVVAPGRRLGPADIGLLAAMNVAEVTVARRPVVAILAGGDELIEPGQTPRQGQIISSNDLAIAAQVREAGGVARILPLARDNRDSLRQGFAAAAGSDLIVTIGGASVGDHDLIAPVAAELGIRQAFYKIAMRPGKPLMAGNLAEDVLLGLPGNPVSAMVCGIIFMQPLVLAMQGLKHRDRAASARLAAPIAAEGDRQHYLRATLACGADLPLITPFADQDSARLSLMSQADALLVRPAHDPARAAGEIVRYLPLRR